jgi:Brp/Blh family beta-carotene 15,15'-monooxygenase
MSQTLFRIYQGAGQFSRAATALAVLLFAGLQISNAEVSIKAQVVLAVIALAIGIPHGAIDHLITIPRDSTKRFISFIVIYTLIAVVAALAIAQWNLVGFQLVVLMSALHFGFGDAAYANESQAAADKTGYSNFLLASYAIPAGFLPVVLPLTDKRTLEVLQELNPELINWAGTFTQVLRNSTLAVAVFSTLLLVITRNYSLALDLVLLLALSFFAPPLVAFAVYFGLWHAIRHTARLVPKLPSAMQKVSSGKPLAVFFTAVIPGLYAIAGIFLLGIFFVARGTTDLSSDFLWVILVIIWALTVPHMATTAKFDLRAFKNSLRP